MAETTADVRRDIELTRDRISNTLDQLERKANVQQIIKDHPWPAVGLAVGAGFLLSGSRVDVKASATTLAATKGASSRLGTVLDDLVANLMGGLSAAFEQRVEGLVNELKVAIGAPTNGGHGASQGASHSQHLGNMGSQMAGGSAGAGLGSSGGMGAGAGSSSGLGSTGGSFGGASGAGTSGLSASGTSSLAD